MSESRLATLNPIWMQRRDDIAASRSRTDITGRRLYHHLTSLWLIYVDEAYAGNPYDIRWSDDGCLIDGQLFRYAE